MTSSNSFGAQKTLNVNGQSIQIYSLPALEKAGFAGVSRLPYSMKILLENLVRREDNAFVKADDITAVAGWKAKAGVEKEISFMPARVLLQDFTGVPCVVDLAAMRDAMVALKGNPDRVNPLQPVELVIDHSVQVDYFGRPDAFTLNAELEFSRNRERYAFLRWGQRAFNNFKVVPPDTGIVHQVNIEYLARVVFTRHAQRGDHGLPGYARRHRLAHHDGQRARRRRLGCRRYRGGGRNARSADLDAHSAGARCSTDGRDAERGDRHRSGADDHRSRSASREWSASSSSSSAKASMRSPSPTARRSATCARSMARPSPSSRSTT